MSNKKRLIDAMGYVATAAKKVAESVNLAGDSLKVYNTMLQTLAESPTVDAVEVVHGEWDVITDDCTFDVVYQCSVCKEELVAIDGTPAENLWHYCPNCGAKMDGGNEDG